MQVIEPPEITEFDREEALAVTVEINETARKLDELVYEAYGGSRVERARLRYMERTWSMS